MGEDSKRPYQKSIQRTAYGHGPLHLQTILRLGCPSLSWGRGTHLTSMRTRATGALAAKYLAKRDFKVIGMVGAGTLARTQLLGLASSRVFKIEQVNVADRSLDSIRAFIRDCKTSLDCDYPSDHRGKGGLWLQHPGHHHSIAKPRDQGCLDKTGNPHQRHRRRCQE